MRTLPFDIKNLDKGLPKESLARLNEGYGEEVINYIVKSNGLEFFEDYTGFSEAWLYANDLNFSFPWPQLYKGRKYLFFILKDKFYYLDKTSLNSPTSALSSITTGSVPFSGRQWQLIDFYDTWVFVNGLASVYSSNGVIGVDNFVRINAGTEFRGRAVFGGFDSDYFYSQSWQQLWASLGVQGDMNLGENYIYWTSVGAEELLWLFDSSKARDGNVSNAGYSVNDSKIMELYKRGDIGSKPLEWTGKVFKLIPFGNQLIAYGQGGISLLSPTVSPFPSFAEESLEFVGIPSAFAIAGNSKEQCFVDDSYHIWKLTSKGLEKLGYEYYLQNLDLTKLAISYDDRARVFFISDGDISYALTDYGLSEVSQIISSIVCFDSNKVACYRSK